MDRENIFPDISELFPREGGPRSTPIEYFLKNSLSEKLLLREGVESGGGVTSLEDSINS